MSQERFKSEKTVDIAIYLKKQCEVDCEVDDVYYAVRELSRRQIKRMGLSLTDTQKQDLIHDVATNIYCLLKQTKERNFVVTNWIKFVYNKTFKTAIAMYPHGVERVQTFEIDDVVTKNEFREIYFRENINSYKNMMNTEFWVSASEIGPVILKLTKDLCRYREDSCKGMTVVTSVLMSITTGKDVLMYGLEDREIEYIKVLRNMVVTCIPKAIKDSLLQYNPLLDQCLNELDRCGVSDTYAGL